MESVTKKYGDLSAVSNLSIGIVPGSLTVAVLPAPVKTTTLRLVAGLEDPDEGRIQIAGQDVRGYPKRPRHRYDL